MSEDRNLAAAPRRRINRWERPKSEAFVKDRIQTKKTRSQTIEPSTNVFINYIPPNYNQDDLKNLCSQYGEIVCCKIMINLETGQSRCFGFVRFKELSQAAAAIRGIDGMTIGNKKLLAKYAESHERQEIASSMLYIKKLPNSVSIEDVRRMFGVYGRIIQCVQHSVTSLDNESWRCFIQYYSQEEATNAMHFMNNKIVVEGTKPIHVRYADETRLSGNYILPPPVMTEDLPQIDQHQLLPSFFFN
ncbi:hypothetical protein TVAG_023270 [Trichomonas vaginalis G3]|uniref:RRM domain-containing protein n=1 Tax=Trichomonas vaginalis (strain ATCC PRA-98 / G3) TaxID=412133 RepID=A2G2G5_TRIV3|nr:RNA binding [Trichomonas vaginalis G3]EAX88644.1 hypothetical protein TVAG_023270 [Trichomonas vaginalis G3]KAI5517206.1 RNA binding [Trichomonas vaginalis G3]|eukprot:XP_001301574.1 hypothetical protein [Trichomonas vaginalis G3]